MLRFITLRYYRSDIGTQISSLFNGNHFHYSCAALGVAIDIETPIVFLYLRSAAVLETGL